MRNSHATHPSKVIPEDGLKPSQFAVTLTCKRVDSSILGSKLVWEELNEKLACVVGSLSPRGMGVYVTTVRQDFPDSPRYIDPAVNSSSSTWDLLATRMWMQRSIIVCVSRQNESAMETMGDGNTYEGGYMRESLIWIH